MIIAEGHILRIYITTLQTYLKKKHKLMLHFNYIF